MIHLNLTRITSILHEDQYTFMMIPRSFLLTMINVTDKSCRENQNTRIIFNNIYPENRAFYETMWKYCRVGQATDGNMVHALCVLHNYGYRHTHTHTHIEYVLLLVFPQQQWLRERASM